MDLVCDVNLNARVYDPTIGRFLSPDSVTETIYNLQVLNRYTYVGNNPLSYTDPSGHCFLGCFWTSGIFRSIVAIVAAATAQSYLADAELAASTTGEISTQLAVLNAGVSGGISGFISTGRLNGALLGSLEGIAFAGVHVAKTDLGVDTNTVGGALTSAGMHATVGGLFSMAGGGRFGSGFLAAGFSDLAGNSTDADGPDALDLTKHAVVGGIGSVLGGGKFQNGAVTGSFGYLYNNALRPGIGHNGGPPLEDEDVEPPGWFWSLLKPTPIGVFTCALFCGGSVSPQEGVVTSEGIAKIEQHLSRLDALDYGPNQAMIQRLQAGGQTSQDLAFYSHELYEARLMEKGMEAEEAHLATLKWQRIPYAPGYQARLFAPEVMQKYPNYFNAAARGANGLP